MNADPMVYATSLAPGVGIPELSRVALLADREAEGRILPSGAQGTVVGTWERGRAYEVEFTVPFHAVVTVEAHEIAQTAEPPA